MGKFAGIVMSTFIPSSLKAAVVGSTPALSSQVPPAPTRLGRGCQVCAYTKVVNFVCVEHWGGKGGCPDDCGTEIASETVVENGTLVYDVIEAWDKSRGG